MDSLLGIRGELHVTIKVEYLDDYNPFKDSSTGIKFSSIPSQLFLPSNKKIQIERLVEEMLIDDDPEYHLIDSFRSSTKSNEQRQMLLFELSGRVKRLIGRKSEELKGDSVIGYQEYFDLEDDKIIIRGLGTICKIEDKIEDLEKLEKIQSPKETKNRLKNDVILCTLKEFEKYTIKRIGCVVSARSVKLIVSMKKSQLAKQIDTWWNELREEIKSHARTLECTHVIGYEEIVEIQKDLCILSAVGTAVVLTDKFKEIIKNCRICHIPYSSQTSPFNIEVKKCRECKKGEVPEVLISTIEPPKEIECSRLMLIEARVCRSKKNKIGESNAKQVSDLLPFIEQDLHKQFLYKMRVHGLNSAFNFQYTIKLGLNYIVATAVATCTLLHALPAPQILEFIRTLEVKDEEDKEMVKTQEKIEKMSEFYRDVNENLDKPDTPEISKSLENEKDLLSPREEQKSFVVEIDDNTDEDHMAALLDPLPPEGIFFSNLKSNFKSDEMDIISNIQTLTIKKEYVIKSQSDKLNQFLASIYHDIYATIAFNISLFSPCSLVGLESNFSFKTENSIELSLSMMATMISEQEKEEIELIIPEDIPELLPKNIQQKSKLKKNQNRFEQDILWSKKRVEITPNYYIPGSKVVKHLGLLNQHFIRESVNQSNYGSFENQILMEVSSVMISLATCIGANCILNYTVQYHVVKQNYFMLSVYGDACIIEYISNDSENGIFNLIELSK